MVRQPRVRVALRVKTSAPDVKKPRAAGGILRPGAMEKREDADMAGTQADAIVIGSGMGGLAAAFARRPKS